MTTIDTGHTRLADKPRYDSRFVSTEVPLPDSSASADDLALLPQRRDHRHW